MKYLYKENPRARTSTKNIWRRLFKRIDRKQAKEEIKQRLADCDMYTL
jgi:hypothetical protein